MVRTFREALQSSGRRGEPGVVRVLRRVVPVPQQKQANGRNQVRGAVNSQDSSEPGTIKGESNQRAGRGHPALHRDQDGGIRRQELFSRTSSCTSAFVVDQ